MGVGEGPGGVVADVEHDRHRPLKTSVSVAVGVGTGGKIKAARLRERRPLRGVGLALGKL